MKLNIKNMTALILSIIVIALFYIFFSIKLTKRNILEETKKIDSEFLNTKVEVYSNNYGINSISGSKTEDAFFTLGFVHASDRLWQMDMNLRKAKGRMSEIFGKKYLAYDKFIRSFNLNGLAKKDKSNKSANNQYLDVLENYVGGINKYISTNEKNLPYEFGLLSYKPDKWTIDDVKLLFKYISLINSSGFKNDLELTYIANSLGVEELINLIPNFDSKAFDSKINWNNNKLKNQIINKLDTENGGGSNLFSVNQNTKKNSSFLVSDLHNSLSIPNCWYQVGLYSDKLNFFGLTYPGIPFPFSARNDSIAWSFANTKIDDIDYFIYQKNEKENKIIDENNQLIKINFVSDTILIKNDIPHLYYKKTISNNSLMIINVDSLFDKDMIPNNYELAVRWSGTKISNELETLFNLLGANNNQEFEELIYNWISPSFVFNFSEYSGKLGQVYCGLVPERKKLKSIIATPVSEKSLNWKGELKLQDYFAFDNEKVNYLTAANQKFYNKSEIYFGAYFDSPFRNLRIKELVKDAEDFDLLDLQVIQNDNYSQFSNILLSILEGVLTEYKSVLNTTEKSGLLILKKWDRLVTKDQIAPTIFSQLLIELKKNIFADDLKQHYNSFNGIELLLNNKLLEVLSSEENIFYDDKRTERKETKKFIILKSYKDAVSSLLLRFKTLDKCLFGNYNIQNIINDLNTELEYNKMLDLTELSLNGNFSTINYSRIDSNTKKIIGVSARLIYEMPGDIINHVVMGGTSSDPMSINYKNQVLLWLNSGYIKTKYKEIDEKEDKLLYKFYPQ